MKIIDCELKGNMVRFFLGKDADEDYHGDDWDDVSYEDNAGSVYPNYVTGTADISFPFDALVLEPSSGYESSGYCRNDMKAGIVPCMIVVPPELAKDSYQDSFRYWVNCKGVLKFYFNDRMEASSEPALYTFDPKEYRTNRNTYASYMIRQSSSDSITGGTSMKEVPIWEKSNLTITEAATYFGIGQGKLIELTKIRNCNFVLHVGNKRLIKRKQFELYLEHQDYL